MSPRPTTATPTAGRFAALVMTILALAAGLVPTIARAAPTAMSGQAIVYFFWGQGCPHCAAAKPVLVEIQARNPGMIIREYEIYYSAENRALFAEMADKVGFEASGVPTIVLGERYWIGFSRELTGPDLEQSVAVCLVESCPDAGEGLVTPVPPAQTWPAPTTSVPSQPASSPTPTSSSPAPDQGVLDLPIVGQVELAGQSLLVTTLLIALVDGFNPCSLWVLTILLALTLRAGSRQLTLLIGLVFIGVTALMYALFIAGIFSVLSVLTIAPWVRLLVALIAAGFGLLNVKDYFWFKRGPSLAIPDAKKPGIYQQMRAVIGNTDNVPALIASTAALAAGVSLIELACTAGFPVIWANILTAHDVGAATFAGLLLVYMLVYQFDELVIFGGAVITLRASKLQEKHGRILKLIGGVLMLTLAVVMIVNPDLMNGLGSSLAVFGVALAITLVVLLAHRVVWPRLSPRSR